MSAYREFLNIDPSDAVAHFQLARLQGEAGQFAETIQHCDLRIEATFERARAGSYKPPRPPAW